MPTFKTGAVRSRGVRLPSTTDSIGLAIKQTEKALLPLQSEKGCWAFDLDADSTITSEYIMLQRFMGRPLPAGLKRRLCRSIRKAQLTCGGWPLYVGGEADISVSVKAYMALKAAGDSPDKPHMARARKRILSLGGASRVNVFTRIALALFGQIPWKAAPAMPVQIMLLPRWSFFHLEKVSYWSRTVIAPLLILYARRPVCRLRPEEGVRELFIEDPESLGNLDGYVAGLSRKNFFIALDRVLKRLSPLLKYAACERAVRKAEAFTVERMQGEGGIGAIFPAMANAVMALKSTGHGNDSPPLAVGMKALDKLVLDRGDESLCQPCHSPVWDTCLSLSALLEAGLPPGHGQVRRAMEWLFSKQVMTKGDWSKRAPWLSPGGWAFQFENGFYPDVDDTAMVVMALLRAGAFEDPAHRERIEKAVNWAVGMQNSDGGWGAFDIDNNRLYLNDIPFADHGALLDPSTPDLTARCVELLAMLGYGRGFAPLQRGLEFLKAGQEDFGGWFGRWGVNYIYGTWSVLMALRNAGEEMDVPYIRKAVKWLKGCQNPDGGWGESCESYEDPALAGRGESTPSQTAWALLGLMAAGEAGSAAVKHGIRHLVETQGADGRWDERLYTGTGFPRVFYLRYHGYGQYFPLWALGVYRRLRAGGGTRQDEVRLERPAGFVFQALEEKRTHKWRPSAW